MTLTSGAALRRRARERVEVGGWLTTTDHKRMGILLLGTALFLFFVFGTLALLMRGQLSQPGNTFIDKQVYNELFTIHGSGMIYLVVTPFALGLGLYLVPIMIGAPAIAAPRTAMLGYWLYIVGALSILGTFAVIQGGASDGWWAYPPLSDSTYTPGYGMDFWIFGAFCAVLGMTLIGVCILWTALFKRAPHMTMLRLPVFVWSEIASVLMVVASFPALLAAMGMLAVGRMDPSLFLSNFWVIGWQHIFWFYGHPVVYVMFFPFVGAVAEVLSTFCGRSFVGYKATVFSLMAFSTLSMGVWGHHMLTTGQAANDYYQLTSTLLAVPAGVEYFGMVGTLIGGRIRFSVPLLFAVTFIPQFLVGGLTGIMLGTPVFDYHVEDTYFVVAHFHYTLFAGSLFGFFAGFYYWFPKATGYMLRDRLGRAHWLLMTIGANVTFLPMFIMGFDGMPRRVQTYQNVSGLGTLNLISSIGAGIIGVSVLLLALNLVVSLTRRVPAPDDPWLGNTLEWATSSPPPPLNFDAEHPVPKVTNHAPLLERRLALARRNPQTG